MYTNFLRSLTTAIFFLCTCQFPNFDICCSLTRGMLCSLALCSRVVGKYFPTHMHSCYFIHARFKYRIYFCGFGYVILYFRVTILSVQSLLTAPFFGRCVQCTRYQWLCTFSHGTWLFSILLLLSFLSYFVTNIFQFLLWLRWTC